MGCFRVVPFRLESSRRESPAAFFLTLLVLIVLLPLAAWAQTQNAAELATVYGVVRNSSGQPVVAARVVLRGKTGSGGEIATTLTDSEGSYRFDGIAPGTYDLGASSQECGIATFGPFPLAQKEVKQVQLTLSPAKAGVASGETKASAPEFFDEPSFTVAGVTDTTNLGGHGSNVVARTKVALAKDVASLGKGPGSGGAPGEAANEQSLREAAEHTRAMLARADIERQEKAELHYSLGEIEEKLGNPLEAVHEYQLAAELEPSEANLFGWGAELLLHHAPEPAIEVFTRGSRLFPRSARMLAGLGVAWYARGSNELAARNLGAASDLDPGDAGPYLFLGKLQSVDTTHSALFADRLARFARLQPENAQANYYYALSLWKQRKGPEDTGSLGQMESLLHKAVKLDPKLGAAYLQMGILYSEQKSFPKAIDAFHKAIEASPDLEEAHYRLALVYKQTGDTMEAQKELQIYHDISKTKAQADERERHEIQQFVYSLQGKALPSP